MTSTEIEKHEAGGLANKRLDGGLAEGNGVIDPARWQMLAAIAETVAGTLFVPKGLREAGAKATLACLLYGDALGLQPMTSLKEVHVIDGMPGLSAAAMAGLVRKANPGHRLGREELRDEGRFVGVRAFGTRGDTEESDEYTFTLEMAARAGLTGKDNWKKYPEAMCTARAYSQLCTFLFPDVFMGSPMLPEEIESFGEAENVVVPEGGSDGSPIVKPPEVAAAAKLRTDICPIHGVERTELEVARGRFYCPECKLAGAEGEPPLPAEGTTEQTEWEVADADTGEKITMIDAGTRTRITAGATVRFDGTDYEAVGYEVDGETSVEKLLVRVVKVPGRPEPGTPAAVVEETIPKVFEYVIKAQEAGNPDFIRGVLEAERAGKNRSRLTGAIEDILEKMGAVLDKAEAESAEEGEFVPLGEGAAAPEDVEKEVDVAPEVDVELDPEIPFNSATIRAKIVRVKALCAFMEDQHPEQKAWKLEGVIATAEKQWGGHIETIDDLTEEQLELIWKAAEQYASEAVEFLALADVPLIEKLAGTSEQQA